MKENFKITELITSVRITDCGPTIKSNHNIPKNLIVIAF